MLDLTSHIGTIALFQTGWRRPTLSHGHLSSSVSPMTIKGRGQYLVLNVKIKTAKISSGGETGFSWKFGSTKISRYTVAGNKHTLLIRAHKQCCILAGLKIWTANAELGVKCWCCLRRCSDPLVIRVSSVCLPSVLSVQFNVNTFSHLSLSIRLNKSIVRIGYLQVRSIYNHSKLYHSSCTYVHSPSVLGE